MGSTFKLGRAEAQAAIAIALREGVEDEMKQAGRGEIEGSETRAAISDYVRVSPAILILANLLKKSGNVVYEAELGLSSIGWRILARLGADGPMTPKELVELSLFDKGQLSKAAGRLVEDGLISRKKRDWRTQELSLTVEGARVYSALNDISRARHRVLTSGIAKAELAQFMGTLSKITRNAKRLLPEDPPPHT